MATEKQGSGPTRSAVEEQGAGATRTAELHLPALCGVCCARAAEHALLANPHVVKVRVDYRGEVATVTYHAPAVTSDELAAAVRAAGCPCEPVEGHVSRTGGAGSVSTAHLAHRAQMAPITLGTKQDRLQYELAATGVGAERLVHQHPPLPVAPPPAVT